MKISFWGVVVLVGLIVSGTAAYAPAEEAAPGAGAPSGTLRPLNRNTLESLKEKKKKAAEAQKAQEDEKCREQDKKAKAEKIERKTGHKAKSWQVQNR